MYRPLPTRFRKQLTDIIRDLDGMVADLTWWNDNRLDADPLDIGAELVTLAKARQALAAFDRGDWAAHSKLSDELVAAAERMCADETYDAD